MQMTGQLKCKRAVKWNAIFHLGGTIPPPHMPWLGFFADLFVLALVEYLAVGAYGEFNVLRWPFSLWFCYIATLALFVSYSLP